MNSTIYKKLPRHFNPYDTFLLDLTNNEAQTLTHLLPKGFSLTQQSKSHLKPNLSKNKHEEHLVTNNDGSSNKPPKETNLNKPKITGKKITHEINQAMKPCLPLLQQLKSYKHSWPFLQPVDAEALGIPQYYQIVTEPMDLSKVQENLKSGQYKIPQQFYRDINLMIRNSYIFNQSNEDFIKLTSDFQKYFWRIAGPEAKPTNDKKVQREKQKERERLQKERLKQQKLREKILEKEKEKERKLLLQQQQQAQQALRLARKKKKMIPKDILQAQNISKQQKLQLANNIHNLPKEYLKGVRQIVFHDIKDQYQIRETNEFDIQKIGLKKIRQLQKYVRIKMHEMENKKIGEQTVQKNKQIDLDEMQSQWSSDFVQ